MTPSQTAQQSPGQTAQQSPSQASTPGAGLYDLQKDYVPSVGERWQVHRTQQRSMTLVAENGPGSRDSETTLDITFTTEIQAVADGHITRRLRTYERVAVNGIEIPVSGLQVAVLRGRDGHYHYRALGSALPPLLQASLQSEVAQMHDRNPLLPGHPLPVGGTWSPPLPAVAEWLGLPPASVGPRSRASGQLVSAAGGEREASLSATLQLRSYMRLAYAAPTALTLQSDLRWSTRRPKARLQLEGTASGVVRAGYGFAQLDVDLVSSLEVDRID